jgi:hypothetical protein
MHGHMNVKYDTIAKPQYYTNYKNIRYLKEIYSYSILYLFIVVYL